MELLNVTVTKLMVCHTCRGILFHGAPGSGKTLVARALAGACRHSSSTPVTLFARKGADCLGKFAGEAERTLRLLFDEVRTQLFDEVCTQLFDEVCSQLFEEVCIHLVCREHTQIVAVAGYAKHSSHTQSVMHALPTCANLPLRAHV